MRTVFAVLAFAALSACGQPATTETPATTEQVQTPPPAPTVVVISETDARTRAETAGYTNITGLVQNADGTWSATGTREGQATQITIGESGVTVATTPTP